MGISGWGSIFSERFNSMILNTNLPPHPIPLPGGEREFFILFPRGRKYLLPPPSGERIEVRGNQIDCKKSKMHTFS